MRDLGRRAARPPGAIRERGQIFVPLSGPVAETDAIRMARLPAARVASVIHRGAYAGVAAARRRLRDWASGAGLVADAPMRTSLNPYRSSLMRLIRLMRVLGVRG